MIQIGGLGFMTIASIFFFALRRKIGLRQRLVLAQALSFDQISGVVGLVRNVLRGTLAVEGAGALILALRFWPEFGLGRAACGTACFTPSRPTATRASTCWATSPPAGASAAMWTTRW